MNGEPLPDGALERLLDAARPLLDEARPTLGGAERYRIVREIGRGGMGVVYEAEDRALGRHVALKVLHRPLAAGPEARARFLREARAAARLQHPNLAAVYDADEECITMQLVGGVPLADLAGGEPRRLVRLVRDAALAVQHAHEHGVVHRDLKPQNLLVEGDRVFVTDFGLAKELAGDPGLSCTGHVFGTPSFMAPEQARGRGQDADARTDVWGLGATLYAVLAGRPPFVDDDVVRLLRRVAEEEPQRLRAVAPAVPRDLARVVERCLQQEPEMRYSTAGALADDLTRWLDGRPVLARPPSFAYRAARFVKRHRPPVAIAAAALLGLAAAGVFALEQRARRAASSETLGLSARVEAILADAAMHWRLGEMELSYERLDEGVAACDAFLARHDVAEAHALRGRVLRARGHRELARAALDHALRMDPALRDARLERALLGASELSFLAPHASFDDPSRLDDLTATLRAQVLADLAAVLSAPGDLRRADLAQARAEQARLTGDREAARAAYREVMRLQPTNVHARLGLVQLDLAEGKGDAAWGLVMSAFDLYRGFGPAYMARAAALPWPSVPGDPLGRAVAQHELAAAEQRLESGDASAEAYLGRAGARLHLDDVEGALLDFTAAVERDPSDAHALANRSLVRARLAARAAAAGDTAGALDSWADAIEDAAAALTLEPRLAGAWNNRGVFHLEREALLTRLGRTAEAAAARASAGADLEQAVAAAPRFALARFNRAMQRRRVAAHLPLADPSIVAVLDAAAADLEVVLELRDEDPAVHAESALVNGLRAAVHEAHGRHALAAQCRESAAGALETAVRLAASPREAERYRDAVRAVLRPEEGSG